MATMVVLARSLKKVRLIINPRRACAVRVTVVVSFQQYYWLRFEAWIAVSYHRVVPLGPPKFYRASATSGEQSWF